MATANVADRPLAIVFYPNSADLAHSPYASQVVPLINAAFRERARGYLDLEERVKDMGELIAELGSETFSYVLASVPQMPAESPKVYGMGSAHPFDAANLALANGRYALWSYVTPPNEDVASVDRWEIKIVVTDPRFQRQGLGSLIMDLLELEIRRRFRRQSQREKKRCQLVLTTVKELNESYYERLGYRAISETPVPQGSFELEGKVNTKGFTIVSMNRYLSLD